MANKKYFTDESLQTLVDEIQAYADSAASGKADSDHDHAIADISGLQSALDGKAASSHGTHVSFDSINKPKMDGTAAFGTSTKVARADHVHPTDTSRASQTSLDTHTGNTTVHITADERTDWNAAYTHSTADHAPSNAQPNQNAFSNITVGSTTVSADTTTDTVTFVGSNVTITPDAKNDKITFSVADGSTSAKGLVQLTNSTSSTSTTTAATPSSVKSAYDLANTAKTNAATAQAKADSAYSLAEGKVDSLSDLGITATATELNYVDGVTSAIQTQLDGKAASGHSHSEATTEAAGFLSASDKSKLDGITASADSVSFTRSLTTGTKVGTITINGTGTDLYAPTNTNTTYTFATGDSNGQIKVTPSSGTAQNVSVKGLGSAAYTASTAYDAAGTATTKADAALASAKTYTDTAISNLINSAPTTLDTLGEIATAMEENADVVEALEEAIGNKVDKVNGKGLSTNDLTATLKSNYDTAYSHVSNKSNPHGVTLSQLGVSATATELNYAAGVTSAIQTQLDGKVSTSHTHTVSHTPAGTVSKPSFTGTKATISADYTPVGTVSKPSFTGSAVTSGAPNGTTPTTTVASSTHTHKYTPAGTVSKPTFTGSEVTSGAASGTTTVYSITAVGSLPTLTASVANRCLTLTFGAGSLPTKGSGVSVATGAHTHKVTAAGSVSQPTFTGTEASTTSISGAATVASQGHTHSVTAAGSVSQPTFTGTEDTISAEYTPAGSVSQPSFTGTAATLTTSSAK